MCGNLVSCGNFLWKPLIKAFLQLIFQIQHSFKLSLKCVVLHQCSSSPYFRVWMCIITHECVVVGSPAWPQCSPGSSEVTIYHAIRMSAYYIGLHCDPVTLKIGFSCLLSHQKLELKECKKQYFNFYRPVMVLSLCVYTYM